MLTFYKVRRVERRLLKFEAYRGKAKVPKAYFSNLHGMRYIVSIKIIIYLLKTNVLEFYEVTRFYKPILFCIDRKMYL